MTGRGVRAIVVAYGAPGELDACLAAFGGACPVTVVDNSSDPDVRIATERHGATYVDPGANLGFARGVNVALAPILDGPAVDVLLLNPDARLTPASLKELVGELRAADVGMLSSRLLSADGREQRVLWPFPSPLRAWAEAAGLGGLPARRTFAVGAVLLLRWEALRDVGLFDPRFFLYAEEADWQRRALEHGWRAAVSVEVTAQHAGAGTSTDVARREALFHAGQETYVRKWFGAAGWLAYRAAACAGAAGRAVVLAQPRRQQAAERARLYLRGPRRVAGLADR